MFIFFSFEHTLRKMRHPTFELWTTSDCVTLKWPQNNIESHGPFRIFCSGEFIISAVSINCGHFRTVTEQSSRVTDYKTIVQFDDNLPKHCNGSKAVKTFWQSDLENIHISGQW